MFVGPNDNGDIVGSVQDCSYYFAVESAQDLDGDGTPDFLGSAGYAMDSVSVESAVAVGGVISAVVGGAIAASVTAAIGTSVAAGVTAGAGALFVLSHLNRIYTSYHQEYMLAGFF